MYGKLGVICALRRQKGIWVVLYLCLLQCPSYIPRKRFAYWPAYYQCQD